MARLRLKKSGYTFTVSNFEGFQKALLFLAFEKELTGIDRLEIATPPEFSVLLSWLPTNVKVDHEITSELYLRRVWSKLSGHIQETAKLAAFGGIHSRLRTLFNHERSAAWFEQQTGIAQSCWKAIRKRKASPTDVEIDAIIKLFPRYALWLTSGRIAPQVGQTSPEYDEAQEQLVAHSNGHGNVAQQKMFFFPLSICRVKFCSQSALLWRKGKCDLRCWGENASDPSFIARIPDEWLGYKKEKCQVVVLKPQRT